MVEGRSTRARTLYDGAPLQRSGIGSAACVKVTSKGAVEQEGAVDRRGKEHLCSHPLLQRALETDLSDVTV